MGSGGVERWGTCYSHHLGSQAIKEEEGSSQNMTPLF